MARKKRRERKRVAREKVRQNAAAGPGAGGGSYFKLPEGVQQWSPEKKGAYMIDIVPYETKSSHHPDEVEPGTIWYKYPFEVHHGVGPNEQSCVCPRSVGQKCPICEEINRLKKDWDKNETVIKGLFPQRFVAYNILHPDDSEQAAVFALSVGKFANALEKELEEGDEDILNFFDVTEDGRTLKVRFSEEEYKGRKYLEATRIDFKAREEMDEDEVLGMAVCLDEIFNAMPYDKLASLFFGTEEEEQEEQEEEEQEEEEQEEEEQEEEEQEEEEQEEEELLARKKPRRKKLVRKAKRPEPEEEEEEEEPPARKKKISKKKISKKKTHSCPAGGTFGRDIDSFDECDECAQWEECDAAGE